VTIALTQSSWINAWSLRRACEALGVDLRVDGPARDLPLPRREDAAAPDWLFFTDEASLMAALQADPPVAFLPRHFPPDLLDDKWAFAAFLAHDPDGPQGLTQWPLDAATGVSYPLLLKSRHSWVGQRKLPRGWVCRDASELAARRAALAAAGLKEDWFFLQEWLGDQPLRLMSVSGFFDARDENRNLAIVTERVADYGDAGPSSSAMLVTVADEHGLIGSSVRVLRRLGYRGPYELEFLAIGQRCLGLELNPRFWMQHGLFVAAGNGLVKRYLGRETPADLLAPPPERLLWVDGFWLLRRLLRFDLRVLGLWRRWVGRAGYRPVICPSIGYVCGAILWRAVHRRPA
jgi:hypothetical protein